MTVKGILGGLLALALALGAPPARTQTIPQVPDRCCGYRDCRRAKTALLHHGNWRSTVLVDGKAVEIPTRDLHWSDEGWYCGWDVGRRNPEACPPGELTSRCTLCVVVPRSLLLKSLPLPEMEVLPVRGSRKLLLPIGRECGQCHK